jgi:hypothetical protein
LTEEVILADITKMSFYSRSWVYTASTTRSPSGISNQVRSKANKQHLKLATSALIRRPKRASSPDADQTPETDSPASDQTSRALALANADHALGVLGLSLTLRVHDAVDSAADAEVWRRFDDQREITRAFSEIVDLGAADDSL